MEHALSWYLYQIQFSIYGKCIGVLVPNVFQYCIGKCIGVLVPNVVQYCNGKCIGVLVPNVVDSDKSNW